MGNYIQKLTSMRNEIKENNDLHKSLYSKLDFQVNKNGFSELHKKMTLKLHSEKMAEL